MNVSGHSFSVSGHIGWGIPPVPAAVVLLPISLPELTVPVPDPGKPP